MLIKQFIRGYFIFVFVVLFLGLFLFGLLIQTNVNLSLHVITEIMQKKHLISEISNNFGYGNGIHAFKNYVLRGDVKYKVVAEKSLRKVVSGIQKYNQKFGNEGDGLVVVKDTTLQYLANIPLVEKLHDRGKSVEEIDTLVKVDDTQAVKALQDIGVILQKSIDVNFAEIKATKTLIEWVLYLFLLIFGIVSVVLYVFYKKLIREIKFFEKTTNQIIEGNLHLLFLEESEPKIQEYIRPFRVMKLLAEQYLELIFKLEFLTANKTFQNSKLQSINQDIELLSTVSYNEVLQQVEQLKEAIVVKGDISSVNQTESFKTTLTEAFDRLLYISHSLEGLNNLSRTVRKKLTRDEIKSSGPNLVSVLKLNLPVQLIEKTSFTCNLDELSIKLVNIIVVLKNLILTISEYSTSEDLKIGILIYQHENTYLFKLSFTNTKIGIESQSSLFEPFYTPKNIKIENSQRLGLYLSKRVLEEAGGELSFSSFGDPVELTIIWPECQTDPFS